MNPYTHASVSRPGFGSQVAQGSYLDQTRRFSTTIVMDSPTWDANTDAHDEAVQWAERRGFVVLPYAMLPDLAGQKILLLVNMHKRALPHRLIIVQGRNISPSNHVDDLTLRYGHTEVSEQGGLRFVKRGAENVRLLEWQDLVGAQAKSESMVYAGPRRDIFTVVIRSRQYVASAMRQLAYASLFDPHVRPGYAQDLWRWRTMVLDPARALPPAPPLVHPETQGQQAHLDRLNAPLPVIMATPDLASAPTAITLGASNQQAAPAQTSTKVAEGAGKRPRGERHVRKRRNESRGETGKRFFLMDEGVEDSLGTDANNAIQIYDTDDEDTPRFLGVKRCKQTEKDKAGGTGAEVSSGAGQPGDGEQGRMFRELSMTFSQLGLDGHAESESDGCGQALDGDRDGNGGFVWPTTLSADFAPIDPDHQAFFWQMVLHLRSWRVSCRDGWPRLQYKPLDAFGAEATGRNGWMNRCPRAPGSITVGELWRRYRSQLQYLCPHLILLDLQRAYRDEEESGDDVEMDG